MYIYRIKLNDSGCVCVCVSTYIGWNGIEGTWKQNMYSYVKYHEQVNELKSTF